MLKYFKLVRIVIWPASLFGFAVGFGVGADKWTDLWETLFGFLSLFSFLGFAYALNFYADRDVDIYDSGRERDIDRSKQPLVTGEVTKKECIVFCILTFLITILFSALVNRLFALLMFSACIAGGILYSHPWIRLKATPIADILCMATLSALLFSAGYLLGMEEMPTWLMIIFFSLFSATLYIPTVVSDYQYDRKAGLRTSAVVFGQRNLMVGMVISCMLSLLVAYWILASGYYPLGTKAFVIFAWVASAVITTVIWKSLKPPNIAIPILSSHPRQAFILASMLTLLFIIYGLLKVLFPSHFQILQDPFRISWDIFG